tara:strand:- start:16836 stop:19595 length:2760 start_codon:yes stop_codon:yes gene_type:complete
MLLKNLIKDAPQRKKNILISGLATNSKDIKKNYIFFAIKGNKVNGEKFIKKAIAKGASVIVCSKKCKINHKNVIIIKKKDVRYFLSEIASKFYHLKPKNIIAVTGTNGKTSVADIFYQILRLNNISAGSIGTLGIKFKNNVIKTNLTSPDTIALHKNLYFLKKKKIDNVIIEASSHGLHQKRLHHIKFKGAIFTNFSQDHLDYHKSMNSYLKAKLILFKDILRKKTTIISDKEISPFPTLKKIAIKKDLKLHEISTEEIKIKKTLSGKINKFKIKNLAMAIKALKICGFKDRLIYNKVKKLKDTNGRYELVKKFQNGIKVFIDYAHTPDALLKTVKSLKNDYGNNVSLVFGCGGDRDQKKRPLMAKIASKNCKRIFITDDNPRSEDPKKIRSDLVKNISNKKVFNIGNRKFAIKKAISSATLDETILIAGKGHEEKQIYKNKIFNISDKKIVKNLKIKLKKIDKKKRNYIQNNRIFKKIFGKIKFLNIKGLSIDSRTIKKENIFLTIKGKKNDGDMFIFDALKKGAGCVVSPSYNKTHNKIFKINNSINFLNEFAKLKREYSLAKIIAITGSTGKTSLKNLIKDLLKSFGKTYFSPKSFNNHLGVPISLSNLSYEDKFGIFEVGMSKAGEIRDLSRLIKPNIGVITNIGEAHLENFKNVLGIAKAKSEIMENLTPGGTIVLNKDDRFFKFLLNKAKKYNLKVLTFGINKKSDVYLEKISKKKNISIVYIKINNFKLNFKVKDLNIYNVLASLAVLLALKIDPFKIISQFVHFEPPEGRGKKYSVSRYKKKFKLIDESYNASPLSVKNAIKKLSLIKKEKFKKFLILGDMLELGSKSNKYHKDLSKVINNSDIDKVFIKGKETILTYKHIKKDKRGNILQYNDDIDFSLSKVISHNDYLMIKGSNATGLNDFSKKMIKGI